MIRTIWIQADFFVSAMVNDGKLLESSMWVIVKKYITQISYAFFNSATNTVHALKITSFLFPLAFLSFNIYEAWSLFLPELVLLCCNSNSPSTSPHQLNPPSPPLSSWAHTDPHPLCLTPHNCSRLSVMQYTELNFASPLHYTQNANFTFCLTFTLSNTLSSLTNFTLYLLIMATIIGPPSHIA